MDPVVETLGPVFVKTAVVSVSIREPMPDSFLVLMSALTPDVPTAAELPLSSIPELPLPTTVSSLTDVPLTRLMRLIWCRTVRKMCP